jgi:2,4-dienoyl-CoA reductase-like NADH-dependent reductase (Old Yellow Enzyme family)
VQTTRLLVDSRRDFPRSAPAHAGQSPCAEARRNAGRGARSKLEMSTLFSPFVLRALTLPNRVVVSPMCQYSADHGRATAWHLLHLGSLALSGAGMLCIEATAVEPDGRITAADLGLYDDATEQALRPVLAAIRQHSKIAVTMQLAHAGRKASTHVPWQGGHQIAVADGGWIPHAPSAVPQRDGEVPPIALDAAGLARVRDAFATTAGRAARLGIDGLELHAAHGYLLHEFLSPIANHRTDDYGGSLANRLRFPLEVFDAVRAAFPADRPVGVRVSATDWIDRGWDLAQTVELARALHQRGADWIDVSSGGISSLQKVAVGPGYQVPFAQAIKQATGVTTMAVGMITEPRQAEAILTAGQADLVALARGMLYDPRWPWHAAAELGATVDAPPQYLRAAPADHAGLFHRTPR